MSQHTREKADLQELNQPRQHGLTDQRGSPDQSNKSIRPPDTPYAWLQVVSDPPFPATGHPVHMCCASYPGPDIRQIGGFFLMFNCWGTIVSFGTYQRFYESLSSSKESNFNATPSVIAWIGSIQAFLLLFVGALCGRIFDAGYLRHLIVIGGFLIVFGLMMTSLITSYWQALLSQGICTGVGCGCLLIPSIGAPSTWFVKYRGLAIGCVTSGAAVGGVVLPIALQRLIVQVGFPWAIRISAFIALGTLSVSVTLMRQRLPPRRRGAFFEFRALKEPEFALYGIGMFFNMIGFYQFYNFVQSWADASNLSMHGLKPIYLLPIMNAASIPGRLLPTILSDTIGPLNVQIPAVLISAILMFAWLAVSSLRSLLIVTILYGISSGSFIALPPAAVASLTKDMRFFGGRTCSHFLLRATAANIIPGMGVVLSFMSLGSLIGGPSVGAIIQSGKGENYDSARVFAGTALVLGGCLVSVSRLYISRRAGRFTMKV